MDLDVFDFLTREQDEETCFDCIHYSLGDCRKEKYEGGGTKINEPMHLDPDSEACDDYERKTDGEGKASIVSRPFLMALRPPLLILGFLAPIALLAWVGNLFTIKGALIIAAVGAYNLGANLLNEWNDRRDDLVKEGKDAPVLKCEKDAVRKVLTVTLVISAVSVVNLAFFFDPVYTVIGFGGIFLGLVYNGWRKKGVLGNIALGVSYGCAVLIAVWPDYWTFAVGFGLFTVGHNISAQIQDLESDVTVTTFPQQVGVTAASVVVAGVSGMASRLFLGLGLHIFFVAPVLIVIGILGFIATENKEVIEYVIRIGARVILLLGFIWMLVSSLIL